MKIVNSAGEGNSKYDKITFTNIFGVETWLLFR